MTLKELLDFEFTANEDGEVIALVPLSRVNEIADILTNQKEKIDKAIEYIKSNCEIIRYENYDKIGNVDGAILLKILDGTNEILGDKENE